MLLSLQIQPILPKKQNKHESESGMHMHKTAEQPERWSTMHYHEPGSMHHSENHSPWRPHVDATKTAGKFLGYLNLHHVQKEFAVIVINMLIFIY